ncbi:acyltransferase family protein [Streptomyces fulvoviolaceus]|uniref:acyltransferase family protein n=1 Tax=Streptomyces fulvoviolaceus TaxID=285535 RepID=UPI0021BFA98F|nr:acyltransferase [Streptomyces fulvoviolaceus]MCT9083684.1 acyltransferase [Streptomyces fulvoviolaceus]
MTTDNSAPETPRSPAAANTLAARRRPAEATGRSRASRLPSLTGMRFLAALLVFFYHSSLPRPAVQLMGDHAAWKVYYLASSQAGALGVTFFFVLSGFVLTWSARGTDTARAFWRRRYVKIVPNYVLTWALSMVLFAAAVTPTWMAVTNLFMLQSWIPDIHLSFSVDTPSWSLGVEALFYALFPLLLFGVRRIRAERLKYWFAGTFAGIVATAALSYALLPASPALSLPYLKGSISTYQYWFAYVFPVPRVLDFALGILLARLVMAGRWRDIGVGRSVLLLAVGYAVALEVPYLYGQIVVCVLPAAVVIAAGAMADASGSSTVFNHRPMIWLGEISFAFYLVHWIVLATSRKALGTALFSTPVSIALTLGQIAVAVLLSWAVYVWFERPIVRRWSTG